MADPNETDGENTTPPPTEEEKQTQTVDDEVKPKTDPEPESEPSEPDVSTRLDAIEKDIAALKAMMDTLGYNDPDPEPDNDGGGDSEDEASIEKLFD